MESKGNENPVNGIIGAQKAMAQDMAMSQKGEQATKESAKAVIERIRSTPPRSQIRTLPAGGFSQKPANHATYPAAQKL